MLCAPKSTKTVGHALEEVIQSAPRDFKHKGRGSSLPCKILKPSISLVCQKTSKTLHTLEDIHQRIL